MFKRFLIRFFSWVSWYLYKKLTHPKVIKVTIQIGSNALALHTGIRGQSGFSPQTFLQVMEIEIIGD